jgi:hypothetical protein
MEALTQRKPLTFKLGVNHTTKRLDVIVFGERDSETKGTLTVDEINDLMARLSQLQYALVLSEAGREVSLSQDANIAFPEATKYALVKLDTLARYKAGVEEPEGNVALMILGSSGRLTGYRMSPEKACTMARDILNAAGQTPTSPSRSVQ